MAAPTYVFVIRRQPQKGESAKGVYQSLCSALRELKSNYWAFDVDTFPKLPAKVPEFVYPLTLTKSVTPKCRCYVSIQVRPQTFRDNPGYDDFLDLDFRAKPEWVADLARSVVPGLVTAFGAYIAYMEPDEISAQDQPAIVLNGINGRHTLVRFAPMQFIGKDLCIEALKMPPKEVAKRIKPLVGHVEILTGGVYYFVDRVLTPAECDDFDRGMRDSVAS